jgi:hypothetical protein
LYNEELHNLYALTNIIIMVRSRRIWWTEHISSISWEEKCIQNFDMETRRTNKRPKCRWEDNS